ncbi:ABC transporter ATP-binding protein [Anaeromicrobium sediminis]|uniref:Quaternary amine transport ATP-binding protein n=1 Tax=Anaeromicrobium sediminis TaxID=1478221 RepID=A0A267MCD0_9FIRM|nr:betaine/proline/choline family ABC transporter ATP-binding protein [Anaeromicrobium sediminis]PAB57244.1 glycine/betaine ABC transporter ATP-binding protein [Anaeromicrobium sediminis]
MIRFENVTKIYEDGFKALDNINLHVKEGELLVLIGPSGCGKTTTMKMINRLIDHTKGKIYMDNKEISKVNPVELRRNIGYVIQQIGLLPHMTIAENVALVPKLKKMDKEKYMKRVDELLDMVGLDPKIYKSRYPAELSGGQQQRVGVIRALAADPPVILMDEPFSALDPISREQLQKELVRLQQEIKKTIVFVTHDMDEALEIADRICLMKDGQIIQLDTPEKILRHPANEFVSEFIGEERLNSKKALPPITEVMIEAVTTKPDRGLAEALKLMRNHKVTSLAVVDKKNKFLGSVGVWNIQRNFSNEDLKVKDVMKTDIPFIKEADSLEEAIDLFLNTDIKYVPVLNNEKALTGVITHSSLVEILASRY